MIFLLLVQGKPNLLCLKFTYLSSAVLEHILELPYQILNLCTLFIREVS